MTRGGKTYYYHTNYRGDVVALTDSAGAVVATYQYDAYGNLLKETGNVENPYRYAGYRYNKESGLYYLQSRYYNPETGRFLTRDTFEGFENEPLSLNKYAYAENKPILYTDPSGHARPQVITYYGRKIITNNKEAKRLSVLLKNIWGKSEMAMRALKSLRRIPYIGWILFGVGEASWLLGTIISWRNKGRGVTLHFANSPRGFYSKAIVLFRVSSNR